jgi:hypothetical protein
MKDTTGDWRLFMRINYKLLSIPPYISTSWESVTSIHLEKRDEETLLVVSLDNGICIEVPNLEPPIIDAIFAIHAKVIEQEDQLPTPSNSSGASKKESVFTFGFPLPVSMENLEQLGTFLQHNQTQAGSPDLPQEILGKVSALMKTIGIEDPSALPHPEPHCNCPHCQIARALHQGLEEKQPSPQLVKPDDVTVTDPKEAEIPLEELHFREWDIRQTDNCLYQVANPLDEKECYSVYLGDCTGCTCGEKNCEHIHVVRNRYF